MMRNRVTSEVSKTNKELFITAVIMQVSKKSTKKTQNKTINCTLSAKRHII